jgi:hypothetical protein
MPRVRLLKPMKPRSRFNQYETRMLEPGTVFEASDADIKTLKKLKLVEDVPTEVSSAPAPSASAPSAAAPSTPAPMPTPKMQRRRGLKQAPVAQQPEPNPPVEPPSEQQPETTGPRYGDTEAWAEQTREEQS